MSSWDFEREQQEGQELQGGGDADDVLQVAPPVDPECTCERFGFEFELKLNSLLRHLPLTPS